MAAVCHLCFRISTDFREWVQIIIMEAFYESEKIA